MHFTIMAAAAPAGGITDLVKDTAETFGWNVGLFLSQVISFVIVAGSKNLKLTKVPVGPLGTTARNIYRLGPADNGLYKLAGTISDNSTTEFRDIGVSAAHPTLCGRCAEVVEEGARSD